VFEEEVGEPQIDVDNDLLAKTDEVVISLHALDGISSPQTLKI